MEAVRPRGLSLPELRGLHLARLFTMGLTALTKRYSPEKMLHENALRTFYLEMQLTCSTFSSLLNTLTCM